MIQKDWCLIPLHASEASSRPSDRVQCFTPRRSNVLEIGLSFCEIGAVDTKNISLSQTFQQRQSRALRVCR